MKNSLMLLVAFRLIFSFYSLSSKREVAVIFYFLVLVKEGEVFIVLICTLGLSSVCSVVFSWLDLCVVFETYIKMYFLFKLNSFSKYFNWNTYFQIVSQ